MKGLKRHIYIMCAIVVVMLSASGCYNNGYIGIYYGSWSLDSYTVDGATPSDFVPGAWVWSFQGGVVCIEHNLGQYNDHTLSFGSWSESDDGQRLELNFTHSDDATAPGTGIYAAPKELGFESNAINVLRIVKSDGGMLNLEYVDLQGNCHAYSLKKTW